MQARFVKNLGFLLVLNLLIKPLWVFAIDRQAQNVLGEESYGMYFALFNLGLLFSVLQDLGINNFNNRHMAQNRQLFQSYFPKIFSLKIVLGLISFLLVLGVGFSIGYRGFQMGLLALILFNQSLLSLVLFVRSNLGGLHLFRRDSVISVLDRLLVIITCGILLYIPFFKPYFTIVSFLLAQTFGYVVTLLVGLLFLFRSPVAFRLKFSLPFSILIIKKSLPYALLIMLMYFYTRTDAVMLERIHPAGQFEAGIYAKGFRILDAVNMISYLFAVILLPTFARMVKKSEHLSRLTGTSVKLLVFPLIVGVTGCYFFRDRIMDLLYWQTSVDQNLIFGLIMLNAVPMGAVYIFGTLLTAGEKLRFLNTVAITGVLFNVALNLMLIPFYGAMGATVATLITQFGTAAVQVAGAYRYYNLTVSGAILRQSLLFAGIFAIGIYGIVILERPGVESMLLFAVVGLSALFGSRVFKIGDLYNILRITR